MEGSFDGVRDELEGAAALLRAGRHGCPDALAPPAITGSTCSLSDPAIDHAEAKRLLGDVVRRLDIGFGDEREVGFPMNTKAFGEVRGFASGLRSLRHHQKIVAFSFEPSSEAIGRDLLELVDDLEDAPESVEYPFAIVRHDTALGLGKKPRFSDHVRQAELHGHRGVFHVGPVGREVVVADDRLAVRAEDALENLRTAVERQAESASFFGTTGKKRVDARAISGIHEGARGGA